MFKKTLFFACLVTVTTVGMAKEITVVNGGSKSGVTFIESQAIANLLSKNHDVHFVNPGNACVAQGIVKKTKDPVLFIWDSTYEASAKMNNPDCQIEFNPKQVMRVDTLDWRICSLRSEGAKKTFISPGSQYKIGHANPASLFSETVSAINSVLGSSHVAVHYSTGLSSLVTALQNKEIDYALISTKFANKVQEQGVSCEFTLDTKNKPSLPSLAQYTGKTSAGLVRIYQVMLVGQNFDDSLFDSVRNQIKTEQETSGTDLYNLYKGLTPSRWNHPSNLIESEWRFSVDVNIVKR